MSQHQHHHGGGACHASGKYNIGDLVGKTYAYARRPGQCNPKGVYVDNAYNRRNCPRRIGKRYRTTEQCSPTAPPPRPIESNENVRVAKSLNPAAGKGLFAARDFDKNDNVADLNGVIKAMEDAPPNHIGYLVYWSNGVVLDTLDEPGATLGRFANSTHKDPKNRKANVKIVVDRRNKRARLKALRPIREGQEILLNYGKEFFD